jgi:hypothetical protein
MRIIRRKISVLAVPAVALGLGLAAAACSGSSVVHAGAASAPSAPSNEPNASLANAYLATGSGWINYLQWSNQGVGSLTDDTLTGQAPNEQVSSNQTPITVAVNGSEVTFSGLNPQNGTLSDGTLILQVLASDGTLGTDTFTPATQSQFNAAVQSLQGQAVSDNAGAAQASASASAAASQQQADSSAQQQMTSDLAALQGFSLSSDVSQLNTGTAQTGTDLGTVKTGAAAGPGQFCGNVSTVGGDADTVLGDQDTVGGDVDGFNNDLSTGNGDISAVQADVKTLQGLGLPVPGNAQSVISQAQSLIGTAVTAANGDIATTNADASSAVSIANGMVSGACSTSGQVSAPNPVPTVG